jgi:hypothetical protein
MVPEIMASYYKFREECYGAAGEQDFKFHSERHAYAQKRYRETTGDP